MRFLAIAAAFAMLATSAQAERIPSHCIALSQNVSGVQYAALGSYPELSSEEVRFHFVGHSTFVIETPGDHMIATDYTGHVGTDRIPDVVTMNHAHDTHWTAFPDPAIKHVLKGWVTDGKPADHYVDLEDVVIRNVTTDIRDGLGGRIENDNSIFVFEAGGLCIGHLGHLHHEPSDEQYAMIGRLDVVMAPVDGGRTVDVGTMIRILKRAKASIVLPMHWWGDGSLNYFTSQMSDEFDVERPEGNSLTVTLRDLPRRPKIVILQPNGIK
jgi:L-ascorbate metabolism protein UlaG (beta-lactamase superfamily)